MKNYAVLAALSVMAPVVASAAERTATIEVTGLYCASCPYIAAQALSSVPSAKIVDGFYDGNAQMAQFVVTYDDSLATLELLIAATADYGYPSRSIDHITPPSGS